MRAIIAVATFAVLGWAGHASAQGSGGSTFTTSATTSTGTESPPACLTIGSTRTVVTVGVPTTTIGPACIGVGNRDVANPAPACGAFPPAPAPVDPFHGSTFLVAAGNININVNTNTQTIACVAAAPAAAVPATSTAVLVALALALVLAAWRHLPRRRGSS